MMQDVVQILFFCQVDAGWLTFRWLGYRRARLILGMGSTRSVVGVARLMVSCKGFVDIC